MLGGVGGCATKQPTRFLETCALLREVMTSEGNVQYLEAEARVGIVSRTASGEPENFEDPIKDYPPSSSQDTKGEVRCDRGAPTILAKAYGAEPKRQ